MGKRIYLDHAATTPMRPEAKAAMVEAMERWANPSSPHAEGRAARAALEDARERIKRALGWDGELIFTSGATEAVDIALRQTDRRILVSAVEHDCVFRAAPNATLLPIGETGAVSRDALDAALAGTPALVAIQHVNSETGVQQPVADYARQVRSAGGLLLSDCSQSAGKVPLPDADMIIVSAHKLGGPPGIGALLVRNLSMLKASGGQEFGYRGGTQNLPAILGFAAALEMVEILPGAPGYPQSRPMADWLAGVGVLLLDIEYDLQLAGAIYQPSTPAPRLGTIIALTMPGMPALAQLIRFDAAGIAVSAGSACSSGSLKPSRTLAAFGVSEDEASCTIRVSIGWSTTADDIEAFKRVWLDMASEARSRAA